MQDGRNVAKVIGTNTIDGRAGSLILITIASIGLMVFAASQQGPSQNPYAGAMASYFPPVSNVNALLQPGNAAKEGGINRETTRSVTAYNVGDPRQTHSKPCLGASGHNLCALVEKGIKICAANFVPLGSKLYVDTIGECIVLDRMNRRFQNRVDIAMKKSERHQAMKFGVQRLNVTSVAED